MSKGLTEKPDVEKIHLRKSVIPDKSEEITKDEWLEEMYKDNS